MKVDVQVGRSDEWNVDQERADVHDARDKKNLIELHPKATLYFFPVKLFAARNRAVLRRIAISREEKSKVCYGKIARTQKYVLLM